MSTVAFAQDWGVDSRTRIDMSDKNGNGNAERTTDQRVTLGATWGGSDWGIHLSTDVNYTFDGDATLGVYEAYASTDLMGYATVTAGRQALNYGSGALLSSRDWGIDRTTWDGMMFGLNLDMADITVGYHSANDGLADTLGVASENSGNMWINAGGEFSGWNVNVLYMTKEGDDTDAATGIDISGEVMGAGITASMNTDYDGDDMRVIGLSYAINDDMGVNVSQTVYGEGDAGSDGFSMPGTNMSGADWSNGQMSYLSAGDEMLSYGLTYNMAGISLGATMHNVTSLADAAGVEAERDVTEISLGYSLNDNAGLSLSIANDTKGEADAVNYMWLTLNVGL
jgi:hypothetical protein